MTTTRYAFFILLLVTGTLTSALVGCATLRLSGCTRLAQCGELAAYSCEGDLVCADQHGETVNAEPLTDARTPCHICQSPFR